MEVAVAARLNRVEVKTPDDFGAVAIQQIACESFVKGEVGGTWHGATISLDRTDFSKIQS